MEIEFRTRLFFILGMVLVALVLAVYFLPGDLSGPRFIESGPIEIISALAYLFAAIAAAAGAAYARSPLRWYLVLWMLLCIVFFGEETSWLQHLIGYETPEGIAPLNVQSEFNLHNLRVLYSVGIFEDPLNWKLLFQSHNLFRLGFGFYFMILPLLAYLSWSGGLIARYEIPYPGLRVLATFWPAILISHILIVSTTQPLRSDLSETLEMIYSLAIAAFVVLAAFRSETRLVRSSVNGQEVVST